MLDQRGSSPTCECKVPYRSIGSPRRVQHHSSRRRLLRILQLDSLAPGSALLELLPDIEQWLARQTRLEDLARLVGVFLCRQEHLGR